MLRFYFSRPANVEQKKSMHKFFSDFFHSSQEVFPKRLIFAVNKTTQTPITMQVYLKDSQLRAAAEEGMAGFLALITEAVKDAVGGELTADTMQQLSSQQVTLWAFDILREEVGEGGFIQLIHNGYGPFFFQNPFARAIKEWGLRNLSKMMYDARKLYFEHADAITQDMTDEEFMALYEQYPDFEALDDDFVELEDSFVEQVACYVDEHLEDFIIINNE